MRSATDERIAAPFCRFPHNYCVEWKDDMEESYRWKEISRKVIMQGKKPREAEVANGVNHHNKLASNQAVKKSTAAHFTFHMNKKKCKGNHHSKGPRKVLLNPN